MKSRRPTLSSLPPKARASLSAARALARERGIPLYLAGGVVRDLFTGRPLRDLDLLVEGDAVEFARTLGARTGASVRAHERFATAKLSPEPGKPGLQLDFASTRRETYSAPGALPEVEFPASVDEDLARRDFTVNAMAMELAPGRRFLDPFGGLADLAGGMLRILHENSFRDDPTRALRGVRYGNRYGWRLEAATRRRLEAAVAQGVFDRVSGDRLRRELVKIFQEPGRAGAVRRLRSLGLDAAIAPALGTVSDPIPRLRGAEAIAGGAGRGRSAGADEADASELGWLIYLLAWLGPVDTRGANDVASRLTLSKRDRERVLTWPRTLRALSGGLARRRPSEVARRASGLSREEWVAACASLPAEDRRALLTAASREAKAPMALSIRGSDLLAAGISPGRAIGRALARTREARLDGEISEAEELAFAVRKARERERERSS